MIKSNLAHKNPIYLGAFVGGGRLNLASFEIGGAKPHFERAFADVLVAYSPFACKIYRNAACEIYRIYAFAAALAAHSFFASAVCAMCAFSAIRFYFADNFARIFGSREFFVLASWTMRVCVLRQTKFYQNLSCRVYRICAFWILLAHSFFTLAAWDACVKLACRAHFWAKPASFFGKFDCDLACEIYRIYAFAAALAAHYKFYRIYACALVCEKFIKSAPSSKCEAKSCMS